MTTHAPTHILEHWASYPGTITLRQGSTTARLATTALDGLLARARRNPSGIARHLGITLDESQLANLAATYGTDDEPRPDTDPDRHVLGFDVEDAHEVTVGPFVDEHGYDRTPGQWPTGGAL